MSCIIALHADPGPLTSRVNVTTSVSELLKCALEYAQKYFNVKFIKYAKYLSAFTVLQFIHKHFCFVFFLLLLSCYLPLPLRPTNLRSLNLAT